MFNQAINTFTLYILSCELYVNHSKLFILKQVILQIVDGLTFVRIWQILFSNMMPKLSYWMDINEKIYFGIFLEILIYINLKLSTVQSP